ncbi:hypothetical protein RLW55_00980 [Hyphomicrobium sp. B1]|uniref:hypothetical protein n=1 Tax=unclassified Hyphomicrobium TaxID=2619925 RepID=UPI00391BFEBA
MPAREGADRFGGSPDPNPSTTLLLPPSVSSMGTHAMNEREYNRRQQKRFLMTRKRLLVRVQKVRIARARKLWMAKTRKLEAWAHAQEMAR